MKVLIDASEIAEQLAECEVGDEKVITFTVTKTDGETIEGTATAAEYAEGEEYEEEVPKGETKVSPMRHKVPKAILLVAEKGA